MLLYSSFDMFSFAFFHDVLLLLNVEHPFICKFSQISHKIWAVFDWSSIICINQCFLHNSQVILSICNGIVFTVSGDKFHFRIAH